MKALLIVLLILMTIITTGQQSLKGKYCSAPNYSVECITFNKNNKFNYSSYSCILNAQGNGEYSLLNDTLKLVFNSKKKTNNFKIDTINSLNEDSITIEINLFDSKKEPLLYAVVLFGYTKNPKINSKNFIAGLSTEDNGNLKVSIPKSENEIWITSDYVGTETTFLKIKPNNSYKIIGEIYFNNYNIVTNETYTYKVEKLNKREVNLIQILDDNQFLETKYSKIKK